MSFKSEDVINIYKKLDSFGLIIWLDGGWGVDALLGEETRLHDDLDIIIQEKDVLALSELLAIQGYIKLQREDTTDWNFILVNDHCHEIDVHVIVFDNNGNGIYGPVEKNIYYPVQSFKGKGYVNALFVRCLTPEYQIVSHTGYKIRDKDIKDVMALCKKFNIKIPKEYCHL